MIGRLALRTMMSSVGLTLLAVVLVLVSTAALLTAAGADPGRALGDMLAASLGGTHALASTVVKSLPRLLTGLAIALALRAGLWNIGAEGQLYAGAVAAAGFALFGPVLPGVFGPASVLVVATLGGAAWAALAAFLRARRGISEVITSLMLVYVAIQLASYVATGPWGLSGATFPATEPVPPQTRLPMFGGTVLHAGVLVAVAVAIVVWVVLDRTTLGVRLRAVGANPQAASVLGLDVRRLIVVALCLSGALAGLAGGLEVIGSRGRLIEGFSPGYGFEGIAVALLGRLRVSGIVAAALLFGALDAGGADLQASGTSLSASIVQVTAALAVTYLLGALGLQEIRARRAKARAALAASAAQSTSSSEVAG